MEINGVTKKVLMLCGFLMMLFLQACSDNAVSKEDAIKRFIEQGVIAAESRSSGDLAELVHQNYLDQNGFNKKRLTKMASLYFIRHKNIYLLTKLGKIDFLSDHEALVSLHVAMAGNVISDVNALSGLRARMYKFELQLIKDGEWLLQQAKWQPASLADME